MGNTKIKTFVSLGMSCQTTHQLRRLTELKNQAGDEIDQLKVHSGIFDWLICPPQSIVNLLNSGIPDFTKQNIRIYKSHPYWADYNLFFWHNFSVGKNQNRQIDIGATFENELTRWSYLRDRFSSLTPSETIFVVSNTQNNLATEVYSEADADQYQFTSAAIDELANSLARYFSTSVESIHLEVVTRENRSNDLQESERVSFFPVDENQWKGPKQSWNAWWQNLCATINE